MTRTAPPRLVNRMINPVVRTVVRRRPSGRLAGAVALLTYRGRRTGRTYTIPVEYARDAAGRYVIVPGGPEHKTWWRNLRTPAPVRLLVTGHEAAGRAELVADAGDLRGALAAYTRRFPAAASRIRLADHPVVVRVTVEGRAS